MLWPEFCIEQVCKLEQCIFCCQTIRPEWQETLGGDISLLRAGSMFMEFAAADQSSTQSGFGERRYDWAKKQVDIRHSGDCTMQSFWDSPPNLDWVEYTDHSRLAILADVCTQPH